MTGLLRAVKRSWEQSNASDCSQTAPNTLLPGSPNVEPNPLPQADPQRTVTCRNRESPAQRRSVEVSSQQLRHLQAERTLPISPTPMPPTGDAEQLGNLPTQGESWRQPTAQDKVHSPFETICKRIWRRMRDDQFTADRRTARRLDCRHRYQRKRSLRDYPVGAQRP
jgi:hypothetical protein